MIAEIVAIGTELLMGQIADSDAQMLSRELQSLGIAVYHHQVVGDNPQRMREALALALSYMESFFPLALIVPLPGVKLGLANIVTLYALYAIGFPSALAILLVRCTLGALFAGNASALLFSLLGGLSALFVMALLSKSKKLSIFGVSIAGAAAHNCGQVCAALITLGSTAPLYYLPFLLLVSLFTGALSGLITAFLFRAMAHTPYGTKGENHHG